MPTRLRRPIAVSIARTCAAAHGAGAVVCGFLSLCYALLAYATEHSTPGSGQDRYFSGLGVALGLTGAGIAWGIAAALFTGAALLGRTGDAGRVTLLVVESLVLVGSLRWTELALSNSYSAIIWTFDVALAAAVIGVLVWAAPEPRCDRPNMMIK